MGNIRDLVKKIRDTKGTFHAKMGTIKDRNGMDLTEAEDSKKKWQEYTEKLYKKHLNDLDGFPHSSDGKESACSAGDMGSIPGLRRSPGVGNGLSTPVFLLG